MVTEKSEVIYLMFKKENMKQRYFNFGMLALATAIIAVLFVWSGQGVVTDSYADNSQTKNVKVKSVKKEAKKEKKPKTVAPVEKQEEPAVSEKPVEAETTPSVEASALTPVAQETAVATRQVATPTAVAYHAGVVLSNGNTAGAVGSEAAAQMAASTGVPQSTWEAIIARESNGNPAAQNASGASGLFQTMPGWGSTATVQDQVNAALNAYRSQGLSAWGY